MTPPVVPPVDAIGLAGALAGASGPAAGPGAAAPQMPQALVDRFQQIYDNPGAAAVTRTDTGNVVSNILTKHQEAIEHEQKAMAGLAVDAPHLSPMEMQVRTMELTHAAAVNAFRMNVGLSFAGSINKSLKSLLTNGQSG